MNVIILTVILLVVFFIIQKNSKFQDKDYPLNSASRDESFLNTFRKEFDIPTKREKRVRLIDALKNRTNTLEKVTKEIIKHQKKFFFGGIENLNPLNVTSLVSYKYLICLVVFSLCLL